MDEAKKKEYREKIESQLKEFAGKMDILSAKADRAKADMKVKYHEQIADMRAKKKSIRKKLESLQGPGNEAWDEVKKGIDSALDDLKGAVNKALSHFKEEKDEENP